MNRKEAKGYATDALLWLATHDQHLETFLIVSGADVHDLRIRSKDSEFLSFVLDFVMTSDQLILSLSNYVQITPEQVKLAHFVLSGKDLQHWT